MSERLENPFPGLRPFGADEADRYFGRDAEIDRLLGALAEQRFVAVVGPSGSGKSSLVLAGLVPALLSGQSPRLGSRWSIVHARPGAQPVRNLAAAICAAMPDESDADGGAARYEAALRRSSFGLLDLLRDELPPGRRCLVVIDQFEELFRVGVHGEGVGDAQAAFARLLVEASRGARSEIFVLLTMRAEYIGACARIGGLATAVNDGMHLVSRMSRQERRAAIVGPIRVAGREIDAALVERVLNDAGPDPEQLPVVQHGLMRTWEAWCAAGTTHDPIGTDAYEATGGLSTALDRHAEDAYRSLPPSAQLTAERLFRRLTRSVGGAAPERAPASVDELARVSGASAGEVRAALAPFALSGTSFVTIAGDGTVDISHESLIVHWARLRRWALDEVDARDRYVRLLENAKRHRNGEAGLLRNPELARTRSWWEDHRPSSAWAQRYGGPFSVVEQYYASSVRRQRLRSTAASGVATLVVGALLAGTTSYIDDQRTSVEVAQASLASQEERIEQAQSEVEQLNESIDALDAIDHASDVIDEVEAAVSSGRVASARNDLELEVERAREDLTALRDGLSTPVESGGSSRDVAIVDALSALDRADDAIEMSARGGIAVVELSEASVLIEQAEDGISNATSVASDRVDNAVGAAVESDVVDLPDGTRSDQDVIDAFGVVEAFAPEDFVTDGALVIEDHIGRNVLSATAFEDGWASVTLTIDEPGRFYVWGLVDGRGSVSSNSFVLVVDDERVVPAWSETDAALDSLPSDGPTPGLDLRRLSGQPVWQTGSRARGAPEGDGLTRAWLELTTATGERGWLPAGMLSGETWDLFDQFGTAAPPEGLAWDLASTRCGGTFAEHRCRPAVLTLSQGEHRLQLDAREVGTRLAQLVVTRAPEPVDGSCDDWIATPDTGEAWRLDGMSEGAVRATVIDEAEPAECRLTLQLTWDDPRERTAVVSGLIGSDGTAELVGTVGVADGEPESIAVSIRRSGGTWWGAWRVGRDDGVLTHHGPPVGAFRLG